jgi:ArsR family transcriptional regulator, lead/cadmium/zinc/bismuth-responsive transcriptional repressor
LFNSAGRVFSDPDFELAFIRRVHRRGCKKGIKLHSMKRGGKTMKGEAPNMSSKEMAQIRQNLEGTPDIEEAAELMNLAGNSTRLKLLYLLENMKELCVCDLAEMLGVSVSAVSQHLAKLKAYGLVAPRRDAQTIYYRLTDHEFNAKLRDNFFKQFQV